MGHYSYDRRLTFKKASNEDGQELIVDIQERAEKFLRRTKGRPEILAELGAILDTPKIVEHSRQAVQRIADMKAIILIAKSANSDIKDMDDDFAAFSKELAEKGGSEGVTQQDIEARLPRLNKLRALSAEANKIIARLQKEDGVDWTASEWLGSKVVLYKELNKQAPDEGDFHEWDILLEGIDAALESYSMDYLQESVQDDINEQKGAGT